MINLKAILLTPAIISLAACGGGNNGESAPDADDITSASSYAQMANAFAGFEHENAIKVTPPTNGRANYNGVGSLNVAGGTTNKSELLGHAKLTADFGANTVKGDVSNFKSADGTAAAGEISVDGSINGAQIDSKLSGMVDIAGKKHGLGNNAKARGSFYDDDIEVGEVPDALMMSGNGKTTQGADYTAVIKAEEQ